MDSPEAAEDLTQDVLLRLAHVLPTVVDPLLVIASTSLNSQVTAEATPPS